MSKIIKKQIERSLPLFLILSLILSSTVVGVVFNLDFGRTDDNKITISVSAPIVEAQNDFASTTVEVRNAPPEITTGQEPYEDPVSTSSSPINIGESISFKTTATDPESNDYFLIVCTSAGVTANNANPPTCAGGVGDTLCVSASTTAGIESTCTDESLASFVSETLPWYAYVCDGHVTQADCSVVSQGNGADEDASPLFVNHAPTLDAVSTTDDHKDPGGTFEFTATSTDTDVADENDYITLHICATNSYSTTTGCDGGQELCTANSQTVADEAVVSCNWADTAPTIDQAYDYYAFIKDWHGMAASVGQGTIAQYNINNVAPTVSGVSVNAGADITLNLRGAAPVEVVLTATLTDQNESTDITTATGSIYWSSATDTLDCTADDNNCYQIAAGDCSIYNYVGATVNLQCTTTMEYYAVPSTDGAGATDNPHDATDWRGGATVYDEALSSQGTSASGVEVNQTTGLAVEELYIPYETIKGGQNSGDYNATTTIVNYGNTPLDTDVSGTDMDHTVTADAITVDQQKYSLLTEAYADLDWTLAAGAVERDTVIPRPTSTADFEDEIYWGINIPGGTPSGNYEGTNTFDAAVDSAGGNWN